MSLFLVPLFLSQTLLLFFGSIIFVEGFMLDKIKQSDKTEQVC